jgi:hypothetical protein
LRRALAIACMFLPVLALGQAVQIAKPSRQHLDAQRFHGVWRVVAVTDTRPNGIEVPDLYLGSHAVGSILYEATGYMCFAAMNPDRSRWTDESNGKPAEMANAAEGYDSYCGTYEIDERRKTVTHHVRVALVPNDVGTDLVRKYEFSGKQLKLRGTNGLKPEFKFWTVTFERAVPPK